MSEISDRIRDFISSELMFEDSSGNLSDDTPLLAGVIDSLGLMQLISFIEEEFEVAIDDAEVTATNFRTVGDIQRLIEQKVQVG
ncbi:MAG: acyl carrier protein [Actinobacteria bacterium]|nr:MAG: acyl carrier protein [Actinomycetota bacterium]